MFFTVPTTYSRPSIEMVDFIYLFMYLFISPCSLSWPHRLTFLAQISYVGLLGMSNVHFRIRFFI